MPIVNYTSYSLTYKYLRTNTRTKFHFSKDKLYFDTYICYEQDFFKKYEPTKKTKLFYFLKWETVCTELFKTDFVELVLEKFKITAQVISFLKPNSTSHMPLDILSDF